MNNYVITILTVAVAGGIVNSLVSKESHLKKYINYIVSLVCVVCLISPIGNVISDIASIKENINDYIDKIFVTENIEISNSLIINTSKEKICEGIKETIIEKYKFDSSDVYVQLTLDESNIQSLKIDKINVTLTGKASWSDVKTVETFLKSTVGPNVEVKRK